MCCSNTQQEVDASATLQQDRLPRRMQRAARGGLTTAFAIQKWAGNNTTPSSPMVQAPQSTPAALSQPSLQESESERPPKVLKLTGLWYLVSLSCLGIHIATLVMLVNGQATWGGVDKCEYRKWITSTCLPHWYLQLSPSSAQYSAQDFLLRFTFTRCRGYRSVFATIPNDRRKHRKYKQKIKFQRIESMDKSLNPNNHIKKQIQK